MSSGGSQRSQTNSTWQGKRVFLQLERTTGGPQDSRVATVRHDEQKYNKYVSVLEEGITKFFDEQLVVETVKVSQPYAMNLRLMPEELHPSSGRCVTGEDAEKLGAMLMFSKTDSKKWPKLENVIQDLQDSCRIPVRITMMGRDIKAPRSANTTPQPDAQRQASGIVTRESLTPLRRIEFYVKHSKGRSYEMHTNTEGKCELTLFPGVFTFSFEDGGGYDQLAPRSITVPARFEAMDVTVIATMKKRCLLVVVDQLNKPFPEFRLRLEPQDPRAPPLRLRSRLDGKCTVRLSAGTFVATYDDADTDLECPVAPLRQSIEVQDSDQPQVFRIIVTRIRYQCGLMLRTRFDEPVAGCPWMVKNARGKRLCSGLSTENGIISCDVPGGTYQLKLEPDDDSPFIQTNIDITISEDGTFDPIKFQVKTKVTDVEINLVTPDGEPAIICPFSLEPQFPDPSLISRTREVQCRTDEAGLARATLALLEPYIFRVKAEKVAAEYMPQEFVFQTDKKSLSAVVARTVFGPIPEKRVVFLVDTSGSMHVYIDDVKAALNQVLIQQFFKSDKHFNVLTHTSCVEAFRADLVGCSQSNIEAAMTFCETIEAGGASETLGAIEYAFKHFSFDACYLVTDGKCEIKDEFLNRVRALHSSHPARPRLNVIGINAVPRRLTWRGLHALTLLTQATYRPVCLEQAVVDPALGPSGLQAGCSALSGLDLLSPRNAVTSDEDVSGDEDASH